jgi:hypothetical protein
MNQEATIAFLELITAYTRSLTKEEFALREKDLGIDRLYFNPDLYKE